MFWPKKSCFIPADFNTTFQLARRIFSFQVSVTLLLSSPLARSVSTWKLKLHLANVNVSSVTLRDEKYHCECVIVNMYQIILRQKIMPYASFWQGERKKRRTKSNPKVFSPKKQGCHKKIFPENWEEEEEEQYIPPLHKLQSLCMEKCVLEMSNCGFWLKNPKYLCIKCETILSNVNYIPRIDIFFDGEQLKNL